MGDTMDLLAALTPWRKNGYNVFGGSMCCGSFCCGDQFITAYLKKM